MWNNASRDDKIRAWKGLAVKCIRGGIDLAEDIEC